MATVQAQRPTNTPICDFYASQIFGNNTATSQRGVMTLILNTAILGNYTSPNIDVPVSGIASVSTYNGTSVNLLKYFDAALYSTNDGLHPYGVAKNFLDDGGAVPIGKSMASNGNVNSAQYILLTHVWDYFGVLLNCSLQGKDPSFPAYAGKTSMYEVHKYMKIDPYEQGWFVYQLTLAAKSIGFSPSDTTIAMVQHPYKPLHFPLLTPNSHRKSSPQLQAICIDASCPLASDANCGLYDEVPAPGVVNASLVGNYMKMNGTGTGSGTWHGGNSSFNGTMGFVGMAGRNTLGAWSLVFVGLVVGLGL
ncbi:hypothetical protein HYALB_00012908 [Hymenoscyphus albidus]|uniref:Uncharacterized protein n=1 Tax=Hymenoscyphus albidus TaxID=595503 RepID=A0A9N9PZ83_9HELO|nr:hypothetical protein HYALB_00012908 [Hymenoscyphus albidus]